MMTFTKTFTATDETGVVKTFDRTYRKMDDKMFEHYKQNPLGMSKVIREHFKIPDDKNFSVSMWPETETLGTVYLMPKPKKKDE